MGEGGRQRKKERERAQGEPEKAKGPHLTPVCVPSTELGIWYKAGNSWSNWPAKQE